MRRMIPDVVSPKRGREETFLDAPWIPVTPLFSGHIKRWSLMSFTASFITGGGGPLIHVTVTSDAPNLGLTPGFYWTVAGNIRLREKKYFLDLLFCGIGINTHQHFSACLAYRIPGYIWNQMTWNLSLWLIFTELYHFFDSSLSLFDFIMTLES